MLECNEILINTIFEQLPDNCILAIYMQWNDFEKEFGGYKELKKYRLFDKRYSWWEFSQSKHSERNWADYFFSVTRQNYKEFVRMITDYGFSVFLQHYIICKENSSGIDILAEVWDGCSFTIIDQIIIDSNLINICKEEGYYVNSVKKVSTHVYVE